MKYTLCRLGHSAAEAVSDFAKKQSRKLAAFGIYLGVFFLFTLIVIMLLNVITNYFFVLISALPSVLKHKPVVDLSFHISYLLRASFHIPGKISFLIAVLITAIFGRRTAVKISQKIYSFLPMAKSTVEGKQRWATIKEMCGLLKQSDKGKGIEGRAGMVLAEDKHHIFIETKNVHTFIIGTTGSGKSQTLVLPSIRAIIICEIPESMVINDFKGELFENTYHDLVKSGYDYYVLNFHEPARSAKWNPLAPIIRAYVKVAETEGKDFSKAIELTNELAAIITADARSDPVWPQSAKSLLVAMILYLTEDAYKRGCLEKINMYSVYNFFIEYGGKEYTQGLRRVNALDLIMTALPVGHPAKMAYATSKFAIGDMRSSIFATLANSLQLFADSGIAYMTGGNDIDFRKLVNPDKPCAIYMLLPENKPTRYVLSTLFVTQCYSALVDIAEECPHRVLPKRVHFILDELGISPRIPNLDDKTSAGRSIGIVFDLIVQSMAQLEEKYGHGAAATIQNNCGNWVYLNSLDRDTNRYVSDQLGNETLEYATYNAVNGDILDRGKTSHLKSNLLMRPEDLPRMQEGEAVIIRQHSYPIHTVLSHYYKQGLPVADIKKVLPLQTIDLDKILYPIDLIYVPGVPNITGPKDTEQQEKRDKLKMNGIVNNMDTLTHMAFSHAIQKRDLDAAWEMINKAADEQRISADQVDALDAYISGIQ